MKFVHFPKVPRYSRDIIITEKIDGTNGQIYIEMANVYPNGLFPEDDKLVLFCDNNFRIYAGSRNRWLTLENDNYGFAAWVKENAEELVKLGLGHHFGEWWGKGINRGYGAEDKYFSLFNVQRWTEENIPKCCRVVPILYSGPWECYDPRVENYESAVYTYLDVLKSNGSFAYPGYMNPEGIIICHTASNYLFKKTFEGDEYGKNLPEV